MSQTTLTISSKNYSSWSLRGWLMAKLARIDFEEVVVAPDDADARAEILLLSPSILVPCLTYKGIRVWDTLAIGEFLNEIAPKAGLLPKDQAVRAHCRSVCGEMHSGFVSLRQALPMNIKARFPELQDLVEGARRHRPHRHHLERMPPGLWRAVPVRQDHHGRRDVRAGGEPLPHLWDQARRGIEELRRPHLGPAGDAGMARGAMAEQEEIEELEAEF